MKKIASALLVSAAMSTAAFAADTPFYGGVSLGSTSLPSTSTTSFGIFGGYKLNRNQTPAFMNNLGGTLAIEAQYTSLGEDSFGFTNPGFPAFGIPASSWNAKVKYSSIGANVVALVPIKSVQHLSGFAKLGFASTSASLTCSGTGVYAGGAGCPAVGSTSGLVWGVGAQYDVDSNIGVRAGYQTYASDVSALYVAALYNF